MVRTASTTLMATIVAITLTACGSNDDPATTPTIEPSVAVDADVEDVASTTEPAKKVGRVDKTPPTKAPELSARGNLVKALGETAGVLDDEGTTLAESRRRAGLTGPGHSLDRRSTMIVRRLLWGAPWQEDATNSVRSNA